MPHALDEGVVLFERYRVEAKLAEGAAAAVYRARDLLAQATVALKVFDPLRSADPVARARFAREFQVLSALNHPGVARALRFEEDERFDVLVMELVEGELLTQRMARGNLAWPEAQTLGRRLCRALEACHRAGVVHRDLKPENVVLHPERGPVILDFGVAWFSSALTLTRTGALVGSPRYLAPELFQSTDVDARADLFALGAVLYEALAGRPVRTVSSMAELAAQDGPDLPPPLNALRPDLPADVWPVLERALAHRPEDRFATAQELEAALDGAGARLGRRLERKLDCSACGTPLVIDLPICPGCGVRADWTLEVGPFAVQILEVREPAVAAAWLRRRYAPHLVTHRWLERRLANPPVPLVVGVSERSAESLASQARDEGCRVEVLRGRAVLGPALRVPAASAPEIMGASALHFGGVMAAGLALVLAGAPAWALFALPAAVGAGGVGMAMRYARRALLVVHPRGDSGRVPLELSALQARLQRLSSTRARRLAAAAVARATPILIQDAEGLPAGAAEDVQVALREALAAVEEVDAHQRVLAQTPRARLRTALARAEAHHPEEVAELKATLQVVTDTGVAHDLAVRRALEACRGITAAMATRALPD
ncbi:MAG: serine/threonine protein kinase [Deltaproteobacteria bacterium]|nr:serine/threonine protein kinase [Deltaproteobacteria bacterium]